MKKVQRRRVAVALSLCLAAFPSPAPAFEAIDTLPWPSRGAFPAYPREDLLPTDYWFQAGLLRDSNVLRTETDAQSDSVTRFGAGIRQEQRIVGRQRFRWEARGDYYSYNRFDNLSHFAYSVLGDWLWEVGNELSGEILVGRDRRQGDISETQVDRLDLITTTRLAGTAAYRITPNFRVRGGLAGSRSDNNNVAISDIRGVGTSVGADYVSPLGNTLGLEYRGTRADAPNPQFVGALGTFVSNDYHERELSLVATYALGAQLRSSWRVGRTRRDYDEIPGRDFDGTTGAVEVNWLPGNKTILGFEAYRLPKSLPDVGASHLLITGLAFGPRWAVTNKVVLSARIVRERFKFEGDPSLTAGGPVRDERFWRWRFALGWEPQRRWQLGLALDRSERESNIAGRDYQDTSVMGNVAYVW